MQASNVPQKFRGLCGLLWLLMCILAKQEGGGKVLASSPTKVFKTNVIFDPNTAHPSLVVSENKKNVSWVSGAQAVPDNPERFSDSPCLLGSPGFTSGTHYWEVEYGNQREWAVGVARRSVKRKGYVQLTPTEGIWNVGLWWLRRRREAPLHPGSSGPGIVGVLLEYERDKLTFYMDNKVTVIKTSFNGEEVLPFFYVGATNSLCLVP